MLHQIEQTVLKNSKVCVFKTVFPGNTSQKRRYFAEKTTRKKSYYHVLQISESATQSDIRAAFVKLSKQLHPDKNPNDPELHNEFVALNEAYTVLSDKYSRREYDQTLSAAEYRNSHTAQEARQVREMRNPYNQDISYRGYYEGTSDKYQKAHNHNVTFAAYVTSGLLGLGILYTYFGYLYAVKKGEQSRKRSEENGKLFQRLQERSRSMSTKEMATLLTQEMNAHPKTAKNVKQNSTVD